MWRSSVCLRVNESQSQPSSRPSLRGDLAAQQGDSLPQTCWKLWGVREGRARDVNPQDDFCAPWICRQSLRPVRQRSRYVVFKKSDFSAPHQGFEVMRGQAKFCLKLLSGAREVPDLEEQFRNFLVQSAPVRRAPKRIFKVQQGNRRVTALGVVLRQELLHIG